jgi:SAM-dependent methyltransferase
MKGQESAVVWLSLSVQQFDALSARWDAEHGPASVRTLEFSARIEYLRARCREMGKPRALDLGCGTGQTLLHLRSDIGAGLGVDISPGMVSCAQKSGKGKGLQFVVADAADFCMSCANVFDLILLVGTLEHLPDRASAINAIRRALADGGRLIVISPHPWNPTFRAKHLLTPGEAPPARHLSPLRLRRLAAPYGFKLSILRAMPYAPWPLAAANPRRSRRIGRGDAGNVFPGVLSGAFAAEFCR